MTEPRHPLLAAIERALVDEPCLCAEIAPSERPCLPCSVRASGTQERTDPPSPLHPPPHLLRVSPDRSAPPSPMRRLVDAGAVEIDSRECADGTWRLWVSYRDGTTCGLTGQPSPEAALERALVLHAERTR